MTRIGVGRVEPSADRRRGGQPGHPQVQRMVVRDDVRAPPGGDHGHVEELGEAEELGRGPGAQDAAAGEDHRPTGARQQLDDSRQLLRRGARDARTVRVRALEQHDLVEQVLRQRQQDRARSAGEGLADGLRHDPRDVLGAARLRRPLGEAADRRDLVDLLEGLAALERALDLADQREHRAGILAGGVDPDGQVGAADGAGAEAGSGAARQLPVRLGHERGTALVAGRHDPDPRVGERVEEAEERLARHGERVPHAGGAQAVGDEPADGPRLGGLHGFGLGRVGLDGPGARLGARLAARARRPLRARPPGRRPPPHRRSPRGRSAGWDLARSWSDRPSCGGSVCQRDGDGGEDEPEDDHGRDDQHHGLGETRSGHGGPTGSSRTGAGPARPARAAGR